MPSGCPLTQRSLGRRRTNSGSSLHENEKPVQRLMATLVSCAMKAVTSAEKSPLKLDPSCSIQVPCTNLPWLQVPSCWLEVACSMQEWVLHRAICIELASEVCRGTWLI